MIVRSQRLRIEAMTQPVARAAIQVDHALLAELLDAEVPDDWPGDVAAILPMYADALSTDSAQLGWGPWLCIDVVLGSVVSDLGFKGSPDANSLVEIGYSTLAAHRRKGYAAEAVSALVAWALDHGAVGIIAECEPDNAGSIGVLRSCSFEQIGRRDGLLVWSFRS